MKKRFEVEITCRVEIEIDERVIAQVNDDWRRTFYDNVRTPIDVAEFVTANMVRNGSSLHQVEGFANLPDACAEILDEDWSADAREVK